MLATQGRVDRTTRRRLEELVASIEENRPTRDKCYTPNGGGITKKNIKWPTCTKLFLLLEKEIDIRRLYGNTRRHLGLKYSYGC